MGEPHASHRASVQVALHGLCSTTNKKDQWSPIQMIGECLLRRAHDGRSSLTASALQHILLASCLMIWTAFVIFRRVLAPWSHYIDLSDPDLNGRGRLPVQASKQRNHHNRFQLPLHVAYLSLDNLSCQLPRKRRQGHRVFDEKDRPNAYLSVFPELALQNPFTSGGRRNCS
jgi:hypothetical protein